MALFQGHAIPYSTCKIGVMKPKAVIESARACIRLCVANVNPPLRESFSGASTASTAVPRIYMLRTLIKARLVALCRIAPAVSLRSCSGSTSWSLLVLFVLQATPLNKCRIANSSTLQMAMITKPTSLPPQFLQTMVPNHPKLSGELG